MQTNLFDPVQYSLEENAFLADHAGELPESWRRTGYPAGVNPAAVEPLMDRLVRLEREAALGEPFCGIPAVKQAAATYLAQHAKWQIDAKRGGPKFPTMQMWDAQGRPHRGGVGSDSLTVRTYFDSAGSRHPLAIELQPSGTEAYKPEWIRHSATSVEEAPTQLEEDAEKGVLSCPICGFAQNYEPGVQMQRNLALARVKKHLGNPKKDRDLHRALLVHLNSGASA